MKNRPRFPGEERKGVEDRVEPRDRWERGVKLLRRRLNHTVDEDMGYDLYTTPLGFYNLLLLTRSVYNCQR